MGGGILQLLVSGVQDVILSGNPEITFFKKVYKRYTNFGIEQMEQVFIGEKAFGKRIRCKIDFKGDLLKDIYLMIKLSDTLGISQQITNSDSYHQYYKNIFKVGFSIIDYVELTIGGQVIDKHYGEWLDIWTQLTYSYEKYEMLMSLIKNKKHHFSNLNFRNSEHYQQDFINNEYIYVPLLFWFNTEPGLALPLIAIQYHEVVLNVKFKELNQIKILNEVKTTVYDDLFDNTPTDDDNIPFFKVDDSTNKSNRKWKSDNYNGVIEDVICYCDYIFLDKDERKMFANNSHEYLITQVQRTNILDMPSLTYEIPMAETDFSFEFNHPIKEIVWTIQNKLTQGLPIYKNLDLSHIGVEFTMMANNIEMIKKREAEYFSLIQPYQNHTCGGLIQQNVNRYYNGGFYMYSFCLNSESSQPTGTLNFSKLDNFVLKLKYKKSSNELTHINENYCFTAYAINYNILKISNGMAGMVYSN